MKAILITPQGEVKLIETSGELFALQTAVGGYIEFLRMSNDAHAYVNEEGKMTGAPINGIATALCHGAAIGLSNNDFIVGNMLILGATDDGDEADVPTRWVEALVGPQRAMAARDFVAALADENSRPLT